MLNFCFCVQKRQFFFDNVYPKSKPFSKLEVAYQLRKLKVKELGSDCITRDAVWSIKVKVWRNWLNRFASSGYVPKALREFRLTLLPKSDKATRPGDFRPISVISINVNFTDVP